MSAFDKRLAPTLLGAEVLLELARERKTGALTWRDDAAEVILFLRGGRPVLLRRDGMETAERGPVTTALRTIALAARGTCSFRPSASSVVSDLVLDTLGETLVAILRGISEVQLDALWTARGAQRVQAAPAFDKLAAAVEQVAKIALQRPAKGSALDDLVGSANVSTQRAWAAVLLLGGLQPEQQAPAAAAPAQASTRAAGAPVPLQASLPADPALRSVVEEINSAFAKARDQDHYQFLGVDRKASVDVIKKQYFELAKRWHSDRFAGMAIGDVARQIVEELFRRADEAQRVLCNKEERQSYDWMLERKAQGLPTDPAVIMEAESLFHRAQSFVRRGQAHAAEPLLRKAVELNKGEAEFWAFLGYAIYASKGSEAVAEAYDALNKATRLNEKLDAAYEFLGRISRAEGKDDEAKRHLKRCLELNPRNPEAQRELRLVQMRGDKKKPEAASIGELIGGLFKR